MKRVCTRIFRNNRTQAVRLPKAVELPDAIREVEIIAEGNKRIIVPADSTWDSWFEGPAVSEDFMNSREQPSEQVREDL